MLLTKRELSLRLRLTESGLNKMVLEKRIPYIKIGRLIRFDEVIITNWINNRSIKVKP